MNIQWYPGHMYKAQKEIKKIISKVDLIIEILDARIPFSSENPMIADLRGDKPCIKILNKSDLADPVMTEKWQNYLEKEKSVKTIAFSVDQKNKAKLLPDLCHKLVPGKKNGVKKLHAMILGIPNVGKSTLINILADRIIAKTGNEPAVTKNQQRINIDNNITLIDTPGVLWPNIENKGSGYRLAITGAIKDTAMEYTDIAFFAAEFLLTDYPDLLKKRFDIDTLPDTEIELLEYIGSKRGCLTSGGRVELDKVSKILINELRSGQIGEITFETPEMRDKELVELIKIREEKTVKKESRKRNWKKKK
ncbi:MAG: ribosome biogenesis GTPase YlqF [Gammaproteobacteria bacterium]|nr:ribosome biogenesis GTPase YlqF [Gammaproteobacteria bacterium]